MFNCISEQDLYLLMDILSINDISAMLAGRSPNDVVFNYDYGDYYLSRCDTDYQRAIFDSMLKILTRAVINKELKATIVTNADVQKLVNADLKKDWLVLAEINTNETIITKADLKVWLESKGVYPKMFFPNGRKDDYMNPNHEAYSPELAVCVKAWEVAQTADYPDQTPKQFMAEWILNHAGEYGVKFDDDTDKVGSKKAEALAKVANWQTLGGAKKGNPLKKNNPTPHNEQSTPPLEHEQTVASELKINLPKNRTNNNENRPRNNDDDLPF